jgi:hypothetical protein
MAGRRGFGPATGGHACIVVANCNEGYDEAYSGGAKPISRTVRLMGGTLIESLISIGGGIASIYSAIASVGTGRFQDRILALLEEQKGELVRLNEHIHYAPMSAPIRTSEPAAKGLDFRDVREILDPVQRAVGANIVASGLLPTPATLQEQLGINPWHCLDAVAPLQYATLDRGSDWVPLMFNHEGMNFLGWQKKGMLKSVLGVDFSDRAESWQPRMVRNSSLHGDSNREVGGAKKRSELPGSRLPPGFKNPNDAALAAVEEALRLDFGHSDTHSALSDPGVAGYYHVLKKALSDPTFESTANSRSHIYNLGRKQLNEQLDAFTPALAQSERSRQRLNLELAIKAAEAEFATKRSQ